MAKVICTLPNASNLINGVEFGDHEQGKISVEVDDAVANSFAKINGYVIEGVDTSSTTESAVAIPKVTGKKVTGKKASAAPATAELILTSAEGCAAQDEAIINEPAGETDSSAQE